MVKAKVFIYVKKFDRFPKKSDLKITEEELPPIKNGEFLAKAVYLSVDPYMRGHTPSMKTEKEFFGGQVAKIIESKHPKYPVGQYVMAYFGWRTYTISDGSEPITAIKWTPPLLVPKYGNLPPSVALGALGMPGITAYFGFLEICKPRVGETVMVTTAAGAVGSLVVQIAKIKGCKVIGMARSDEKGNWLTEELGLDHFINYRTADVDEELNKLTPEGIDCYFDNVGGELSSIILRHMKKNGRISVCGAISTYNDETNKVSIIHRSMIDNQLIMEGFIYNRWLDRWNEGIEQLWKWIKSEKIKCRETVTEGFENTFTAFTDMLNGKNFGKVIVKI